jgi:hypothetical protein
MTTTNEKIVDGLTGAVSLLLKRGEQTPRTFTVFQDSRQTATAVIYGVGHAPELILRENLRGARAHSFRSLPGFLEYLNSVYCATIRVHPAPNNTDEGAEGAMNTIEVPAHGVLFVGVSRVVADLAYGQLPNQYAFLDLAFSEEYQALMRLFNGVSQRELWRLLITSLDGCIDRGLLLSIGQIAIAPAGNNTIRIDDVGVVDQSVREALDITWGAGAKGDKTATIQTQWTWTGRIFECFALTASIRLRLEVQTSEKGIQFLFHPQRLETVLRDTRESLVADIRSSLPKHISVYEGVE